MAKTIEIDIDVNADDAAKGVDKLGDSIENAAENSTKIGGNLKKAGSTGLKGIKKLSKGFKALGTAMKGAGLGLIIAAFVTLKEVLAGQPKVLAAIDTMFTSIGLAINKVVDAVSKSGEGFDSLKKVLSNLMTIGLAPLKAQFFAIKAVILSAQLAWENSFLGGQDAERIEELRSEIAEVGQEFVNIKDGVLDAATSITENIGDAITEVAAVGTAISDLNATAIMEEAKRTTELKKNAKIRGALNRGIFESYDRQAELLRQTRDDERLTIEERQKANNKLGDVLKEQEKIMLENAQAVVDGAQAEFNANKTTDNRVALIEAQNEQEAIKADIAGRFSEQLINQMQLEREAKELEEEKLTALEESNARALEIKRAHKLKLAEEGLDDENQTPEQLKLKYENLKIVKDELFALEQEDIQLKFQEGLIGEMEREALLTALKKEQLDNQTKDKENQAKAEKKIELSKFEANKETINKTAAVLTSFAQLAGEQTAAGKGLAVASATMNTYVGVSDALQAKTFTVFDTALKFANAAAIGTAGIANVKKILSVKVPNSSGSGGSVPSGGLAVAPPLRGDALNPQETVVNSNNTGSDLPSNNVIKAVVVESDITSVQNRINDIENGAELGG